MSDQPTPETDALRKSIDNGAHAEAEMTSFARTLERERDEAREELNEIRAERDLARLSSMESDQTHDRIVGELEKVYKERDKFKQVIIATLEENRHLADGDDCTLAKLKSVVPEWK
jgi:uncharacterized protein (DUF3084 family)